MTSSNNRADKAERESLVAIAVLRNLGVIPRDRPSFPQDEADSPCTGDPLLAPLSLRTLQSTTRDGHSVNGIHDVEHLRATLLMCPR